MLEKRAGDHGFLAYSGFPRDEDDGRHAGANEEADYRGAGPGVGAFAAELQGKEEHHAGGCEDDEAWEVQLVEDEVAEEGEGVGCLGGALRDVDEEEHESYDRADGEIDVEACMSLVSTISLHRH